jgi:hypothetical protein
MNIHRFAEAIPEMTQAEYLELKDDLKANGQKIPIVIHDDQILDGRNRWRALNELGIEPVTQIFEGNDMEAAALVVSLNIKRRHLTIGQRAGITMETLGMAVKEQARNKQVKEAGNRPLAKNSQRSEPVHTATILAKAAGVSPAAIKQYSQVKKNSPEKAKEVLSGKTSLGAAIKSIAAATAPPVVVPAVNRDGRTPSEEIAHLLSLWVHKKQDYPTLKRIAALYISMSQWRRDEMREAFEKFFNELDKFEEGTYEHQS